MAAGNADMEHHAVAALDLRGDEAVLEIGFGPGVGVRRLERRLPGGYVAGVDPSEVMLAQARRRNRRAIAAGRVDLRLGTASALPWPTDRFDGVVSVNNIQEWPSVKDDLGEIRRILKRHGRLSIAVHAWVDKRAKDRGQPDRPWDQHLLARLGEAGFENIALRHSYALSGKGAVLRR
jgi:ubiquinone/menaquinone biosynthesis C-methylase UbiE